MTRPKEIKTGTIPVDIGLHIREHLKIPNMGNWVEAVGMREQFMRKILHAKQMHKHLESLQFPNASMIETLATTDFRLTFRTMQRLIPQKGSSSKGYVENLDESENRSLKEVAFDFMWLVKGETFHEVRSTSEELFQDLQVRYISDSQCLAFWIPLPIPTNLLKTNILMTRNLYKEYYSGSIRTFIVSVFISTPWQCIYMYISIQRRSLKPNTIYSHPQLKPIFAQNTAWNVIIMILWPLN